jgi:hypothetical protein
VTEGDAAIHATRALGPEFLVGMVVVNFFPILDTRERIAVRREFPWKLDEASWFSHEVRK